MQWIIVTALFYSVSITHVYTEGKQRFKRQDDRWEWAFADVTEDQDGRWKWSFADVTEDQDGRWEWNFADVTEDVQVKPRTSRLEIATTKTTMKPRPEVCQPYNPPVPDYSAPGRRLSEVKCYEYIWEVKKRLDIIDRQNECTKWLHEMYNLQSALGGEITTPGEFPHMGAIGWKAVVGTWVFKCGSSLISPKYVLTAGHCTRASSTDTSIADVVPKIVRLGDKNIIDIKYRGYPPIDANISRIISHPQYASPKKYYDIALMELEKAVEFNKFVQPACLWDSFSTTSLRNQATLTGWGVVESGSSTFSPELMAATVDILDSEQCDRLLRPWCGRNWCGIEDHQLCAGKLAGGVDACQSDSGGPLQVKIPLPTDKEGSMHRVIGVISFGINCAIPNLPGIYTRVSSFIDWIEDIVWREQINN